ncbi:hypothetical protein V6N00_10805 [Tersicoccus sp. MR15.9]|uniref:hypothetical protein n=1 Tax=Tersicoccus mangrovi TaxID=3121635 RepID=UPI002FE636C0
MGRDDGDRRDRASADGDGPDDGDDPVLQPDGSFRRPPSPRGGVRGVIDDLFAGQTRIDRRLSLTLVAGIVVVPLLVAVFVIGFRLRAALALLFALMVWAAFLLAPLLRAVRQDIRLRRAGRREGIPTAVTAVICLGAMLLMTLLGNWLSPARSLTDASDVLLLVLRGTLVGGLVVAAILGLQRMEKRLHTPREDGERTGPSDDARD